MSFVVALVGRPNVGKSTLFNRLTGKRQAIEEKNPGVTRDRLYGRAHWLDKEFTVIDTGGLTFSLEESLDSKVHNQALLAIEEADVIVFIVDGRQGVTPLDEDIANVLRRHGKPVILTVNKSESENLLPDFYRLGLGDPFPISATHGINTGDLLDKVISYFPPGGDGEKEEELIRIAVIGRPNVGKSSFINKLLGEERVLVSEAPGTTRDAVDTPVEFNGNKYVLVDTAGLRRKKKIDKSIEYFSVLRSLKAIDNADIALLLLDAQEGVTDQDKKIAGYVLESGKALILALNKWDLLKEERREKGGSVAANEVKKAFNFASFAPVTFTSIYEPRRLKKLFNLVDEVYNNYTRRIPTPVLNEFLQDAQAVNPLPSSGKKRGRIYYLTQTGTEPPVFILFVNDPSLIHSTYLRYLENRMREAFEFKGTPIKISVRKRRRKGEN